MSKFLQKVSRLALSALLLVGLTPNVFAQGPAPPNRLRGEIFMGVPAGGNTGVIFFVDDSGSNDSINGRDPSEPFATIDYAVGRCALSPAAAATGCKIYVMPGHAETISADDGVNIDVAGISIIGLGKGGLRPAITFTTSTAAAFSVEAADVEIANLEFIADIASLVTFIDLQATADGAYIHDNLFREGSQTGLAMVIWTGIADDVVIDNNKFYAPTAGNYTAAILMATSTSTRGTITNNVIIGDFNDAGIHNATSNVATLFNISNNIVSNALSGAHAIEIVSAVTGFAVGNIMQSNLEATSFDSGSLMSSGNTWTSAIDLQAEPSPQNATYYPGLGYRVVASAKNHNATTVDLFTITGLVALTMMFGEVTTVLSATHTLIVETTGDVALCVATAVADHADGDIIGPLTGDPSDFCTGTDATAFVAVGGSRSTLADTSGGVSWMVLGNAGATTTIRLDISASETGISTWYMFYLPLEADAVVVAA